MTDESQNAGSVDDTPRGSETELEHNSSPEGNQPSPEDKGGKDGMISYDRYRQLLSEKKGMQRELDEFKANSEKARKQELEANERYKELWESTQEENKELKGKLDGLNERWNDALKLNAFHDALGDTRKIDPKYSGFIDTSKILIDPTSNKVDPLSARKEVERVIKEFPEIVKSSEINRLPNNSPASTQGTLSRAEWDKLPAKEMMRRRKEVFQR